MVEEAKFFAWLDGELAPEEAARVEAAVAADPELSGLADQHRKMAAGLRNSFGGIEVQPVPERLHRAARAGIDDNLVDLVRARAASEARRALPLWSQMAALAATLVLGIVAGNMLAAGPDSPITPEAGRLVASADLEHALDTRLASAPVDEGPQIGLTFRDKSGAICRTFEVRAASGLACREGGDWRIQSLFQAREDQTGEYRMASGDGPELMQAVDASIQGEPFDAVQEAAARDRNWR